MINEHYVDARQKDEDFVVHGFRVAGLPACMTAGGITNVPVVTPRPEWRAGRARALAARS